MSNIVTTKTGLAKAILNQIKTIDFWSLGAYGAKNYAAVSENTERLGGVSFQVNGIHHKGWATIHLTWMDDYTIIFHNHNREIVKTVEGVYCDQLVEVLDYIEGK